MTNVDGKDEREPRHFWRRAFAFLLDIVIAQLIVALLFSAVDAAAGRHHPKRKMCVRVPPYITAKLRGCLMRRSPQCTSSSAVRFTSQDDSPLGANLQDSAQTRARTNLKIATSAVATEGIEMHAAKNNLLLRLSHSGASLGARIELQ